MRLAIVDGRRRAHGSRHRRSRRVALAIVALFLGLFAGCKSEPKQEVVIGAGLVGMVDPTKLYGEVFQFLNKACGDIIGTASEIAAHTTDRKVWENTLRTKIQISYACDLAAREKDPRRFLLYVLLSLAQGRQALTTGPQRDRFGDQQQVMVDLFVKLEGELIEIARRHFPPEIMEDAKPKIEKLASQIPISDHMAGPGLRPAVAQEEGAFGSQVYSMLSMPLAPVTGLQGVSTTASAVSRFNDVAADFNRVVEGMPQRIRWELELLTFELESLDIVTSLKRDLGQVVSSFEATRRQVEALPASLREEMERLVSSTEKLVRVYAGAGLLAVVVGVPVFVLLLKWLRSSRSHPNATAGR